MEKVRNPRRQTTTSIKRLGPKPTATGAVPAIEPKKSGRSLIRPLRCFAPVPATDHGSCVTAAFVARRTAPRTCAQCFAETRSRFWSDQPTKKFRVTENAHFGLRPVEAPSPNGTGTKEAPRYGIAQRATVNRFRHGGKLQMRRSQDQQRAAVNNGPFCMFTAPDLRNARNSLNHCNTLIIFVRPQNAQLQNPNTIQNRNSKQRNQ